MDNHDFQKWNKSMLDSFQALMVHQVANAKKIMLVTQMFRQN